jgi:hypothetical protein
MYCSLQEAYQVPSFDPASKKKRSACTSSKSAASADAYDPYTGETSGKELAMSYKRFGREDFVASAAAASKEPLPGDRPTYAGMANDYKYYCDNYRVCAPSLKEGFEQRDKKQGPAAKAKTCGPLQPPPYEYPFSEESKKQFRAAVDTSLNQDAGGATSPARMPMRQVDMEKVSGYYDEDLEQYLQTSEMKAAPVPITPSPDTRMPPADPYDPKTSPFAQTMQRMQPTKQPERFYPVREACPPSPSPLALWLDVLVFAVAGVLMIILCDQLVKLGMMMGMRNTVHMLSPVLLKIAEGKL